MSNAAAETSVLLEAQIAELRPIVAQKRIGRPPKLTDQQSLSIMVRMYFGELKSLKDIAADIGVSFSTVSRRLIAAGFTLRSHNSILGKAQPKALKREKARIAASEYRKRNPAALADYKVRNKAKIARKARERNQFPERKAIAAERQRKKRATAMGSLNNRMSCRIRGYLSGNKAGRGWESLVGYSVEHLRCHIERQFMRGMSWENMGQWHIDHIIPLASFSFASPDDIEFKAAWALTNLRPLWAGKNIAKGAKREFLL